MASNNVPKVGRLRRQEAAAPHIGDGVVRSRLYAEKPGGSSTTRHSKAALQLVCIVEP